jgi:hypothetical protein
VDLEGAMRIGLVAGAGRVERIRITSTRPDAARLLLQGRSRSEIRATLPRLFSVCGHSQAAAGELACAVAAGEPARDDVLARCRAEVSAEVVREYAWSVLLDWPRRTGEQPTDAAIAAARTSEVARARATLPIDGDAHAIAMAAFGVGAEEWLAVRSSRELDLWVDAGETAAARFVRRMRDEEPAKSSDVALHEAAVPLLQGRDRILAMAEIWAACQADPEFPRRPTWHGLPAETGALARLQSDPLIGELTRIRAGRVFARFVARLRELARLLAGRDALAVGVRALPSDGAAAWVENARGLLIHLVRFEDERAVTYRIVAPTEWNFHPEGAMAAALVGSPAPDPETLTLRAARIAHSLDPCVACRVEIDDA